MFRYKKVILYKKTNRNSVIMLAALVCSFVILSGITSQQQGLAQRDVGNFKNPCAKGETFSKVPGGGFSCERTTPFHPPGSPCAKGETFSKVPGGGFSCERTTPFHPPGPGR
jgi:hypothetical protein